MIDTTELTVPVGEAVLGRVLNGRGELIDGGPPLIDALHVPVNRERSSTITMPHRRCCIPASKWSMCLHQ